MIEASFSTPASRRALEGLRWRIWALFFLNGLLFSTWAVQVPAFQDRFELQPAELSVGLFMIMLGNFAALARDSRPTQAVSGRVVRLRPVIRDARDQAVRVFQPDHAAIRVRPAEQQIFPGVRV